MLLIHFVFVATKKAFIYKDRCVFAYLAVCYCTMRELCILQFLLEIFSQSYVRLYQKNRV